MGGSSTELSYSVAARQCSSPSVNKVLKFCSVWEGTQFQILDIESTRAPGS